MLAGDTAPGGTVRNQLKDLRTAIALAKQSGVELPLLNAAQAQFLALADTLGDQLDHSAIYQLLMTRPAPTANP
jgi:3-hydroxyisobutyrate dehydrogenase-like beta-hydroxyacid dehydrogenase